MVNGLQIMQGTSNCGWQEFRSEMQPKSKVGHVETEKTLQ